MFPSIPTDLLILIALVAAWPALRLAWTSFLWVVVRTERQLVTPYAPDRDESARPETPYAAATNRLAADMGLVRLGVFRHAKGGMYRVRYDLWATPDLGVIATVAGGTIARLPSYGTRLFSVLDDGRVVMTVDTLHGLQFLADGLVEGGLLLNADLFELLEYHHRLIDERSDEVVPFDRGDPVADLADLRGELVGRLVEDGVVTFTDEGRSAYRYTNLGALRYVTKGVRRRKEIALGNMDRFKVARPGDPRHRPSWVRDADGPGT
jgi:hypothetical protein